MNNKPNWLPELEGTVPEEAYGYAISIYSIAYEAWRRGLDINFHNIYHKKGKFEPRYTISSRKKSIKFSHTRPDLVKTSAINICADKQVTRETLAKEGVPVPKGLLLRSLEPKQVKKEVEDLNYPLVIKPLDGHGGRGVITGIDDFKELMENIDYLSNRLGYKKIIAEEYIQGEDYRAFVVGDKVVGAFRRLPPHVIGDGKKNIRKLLKEKNDIRVKIPGTYNLRVNINEEIKRELKKQNLNLNSVPKKDEFIRLKTKNNVSSGGDPIDATDELTEELKGNLVKAVEAIPGVLQGGVDVIYDKDSGKYAILEINTKPSIRNHLYPMMGNAHEIPKAIIDCYFPETTGKYLSENTPRYYFDYVVIKEHLQNNKIKNLTIPKHPYEPNLVSKKITFKVERNNKNIQRLLRRNFHIYKFNGEITDLGKDGFECIVAGNYQDIQRLIEVLEANKYVNNIKQEEYDGGVRMGITVVEKYALENVKSSDMEKPTRNSKLIKSYQHKVGELEEEVKRLTQEVNDLKDSKSWQVTAPLRKVRNKFKK